MKKGTRRQFLTDCVLAAAMASAPLERLAAADENGEKREKPTADRLQVAVVGTGGRGSEHIAYFLDNPAVEIAYLVDADEKIGGQCVETVAKRQAHKPKFARDLRKMLDNRSVDAVLIATPNHWHALAAIWSMQAGKDVYVEKPVSHNVAEGRSLVNAARKYNRICQAGFQCRSMKAVSDAVKYVRSGKIGEVRLARGLCYRQRGSIGPKGNYAVPPQVDYNLWCGPSQTLPLTRRRFHYDWHWQRQWGNGDMGNQGPHQMDIACWGLGIDRMANRVIAYGGRLGYEDAGDVANTEIGLFEFGDKSIVFEVRGLKTEPFRNAEVGVIFYGTKGSVVLGSYTSGAAFDPEGNVVARFSGAGDHFANFMEAIKARDPKLLHAEIADAHLSCAHSHLANVSYYLGNPTAADDIRAALSGFREKDDAADCLNRTLKHLAANGVDLSKTPLHLGAELKIDPQNESVLDNPRANALLTREYRGPFIVPKEV